VVCGADLHYPTLIGAMCNITMHHFDIDMY